MFLYVAVGSLVVARLLLYPLRPADLTPPYWVAMGATAITVLAGAHIVEMADAPMAIVTSGLVAGASVVFWAFGPWLIPPLVAASIWKHVVHRVPLRYEATLWSVVFPLGMYGVGAYRLGLAAHLPIVESIGEFEGLGRVGGVDDHLRCHAAPPSRHHRPQRPVIARHRGR
ncbi:hypothetical protein MRGA423_10865 [Mycobacterium tuberculosis RGTB423]|nr:hypothetical protein MRGA423_10865 [Mycobacterium tuberculosis RGTB423]